MTSQRKIDANRRNAKRSTGPRSPEGKARLRHNAWRHGLAACAVWTGPLERELGHLTAEIAGPDPDAARWHFAKIAAAAELERRRVRAARLGLLEPIVATVEAASDPHDPEPQADPLATSTLLKSLSRLDRYEERATSRRNRAVRLL